MESVYALMQLFPKRKQVCWPFPGSSKVQYSVSTIEDHRPKRAEFTVVHDSPSIGAGPDIALFQKLKGGEPSDKVLSWKAAIKQVTWQLLSKFLCSPSVCVTRQSWNAISGPEDTRKLSFHSYTIAYGLLISAKTDAEICHTSGGFRGGSWGSMESPFGLAIVLRSTDDRLNVSPCLAKELKKKLLCGSP